MSIRMYPLFVGCFVRNSCFLGGDNGCSCGVSDDIYSGHGAQAWRGVARYFPTFDFVGIVDNHLVLYGMGIELLPSESLCAL